MASTRRRSRNTDASGGPISVNHTEDQPTLLLLNDILSSIAQTSEVSAAAGSGRSHRSRRRPLPQGHSHDDTSEAESNVRIPLVRRGAQSQSLDASSSSKVGNSFSSVKEHELLAPTSSSKEDAIPEVIRCHLAYRYYNTKLRAVLA